MPAQRLTSSALRVTLTKPMGGLTKTARFVIACVMVLAVSATIEAGLLAALRTPDAASAASGWVSSLSASELQDAALRIHTYPYFYRRAIMTALEPDDRALTWRRYLATYAAAHPELDITARALLTRASAAMTPEVFDDTPPAERLNELATIYEISLTMLGRRVATDLFLRLGPDENGLSALPVSERLAHTVRNWVTLHASGSDCDCAAQLPVSCDASGAAGDICTTTSGCEPIVAWPMCGLVWSLPCNGTCTTLTRAQ